MRFRPTLNPLIVAAMLLATVAAPRVSAAGQAPPAQNPPKPSPFPGQSGAQPPATSTATPASSTGRTTMPTTPTSSAPTVTPIEPQRIGGPSETRPTDALLGVSPYPASEFLESYDAGMGQRYYLFGTNALYVDVVAYYKGALKSGGRLLFEVPAMYQFDLPGKFQEQTMVYPPSVVVKDYTWNASPGYLHVSGTTATRYKTIIQIVPATAR